MGPAGTLEPDVATVHVRVQGVEPVNQGRLLVLAIVDVEIDGVVITLQGVRVMRCTDGSRTCEAPRFRLPSGEWVPAVVLPAALSSAIADEVLWLGRGR
jgi:hypothetical protein